MQYKIIECGKISKHSSDGKIYLRGVFDWINIFWM